MKFRWAFLQIIIAMSLSVVALIVMQSIWIANSFSLSQDNFRAQIGESANSIIINLEKSEIDAQLHQHKQMAKLSMLIDSLNQSLQQIQNENPDVIFENSVQSILDLNKYNEQQIAENDEDSAYIHTVRAEKERSTNRNSARQLRRSYQKLKEALNTQVHKSELMERWFQDLVTYKGDLPFLERVNALYLDTLIRKEFTKKNINTSYEWAVYSASKKNLVIEQSGRYSRELHNSTYVYKLFPADRSQNAHYLIFYFPKSQNFIFKNVITLLILSIVLIFIIAFIYYYTINKLIQNKKLSEVKADFINNITHELKTPISTISLVCEALADPTMSDNNHNTLELVDIIKQENTRLQALSHHIIEISKLERGQLLLKRDRVSIHETIEEAIGNMDYQIIHKQGQIQTSLQARNDTIEGDYIHLVNVFSNLIDNAIKYCGDTPPRITINTENDINELRIQICDHGIGMPKSYLSKIFDTLYRIPTGNIHDVKGFGLGLSYVKSVIEKLNGKIKVDSELKKGSCFTIIFPFPHNFEI